MTSDLEGAVWPPMVFLANQHVDTCPKRSYLADNIHARMDVHRATRAMRPKLRFERVLGQLRAAAPLIDELVDGVLARVW